MKAWLMYDSRNTNKLSLWARPVSIIKRLLLWIGALLILLTAARHQLQIPSSWAFAWFLIAALVLLPPSRAYISKWTALTVPRTALIVALALTIAGSIGASDEARKKETDAIAKGYSSYAEMTRAASLGLTSATSLAAHDAKVKADAEAAIAQAAAEAAEKKRRREEEAERTRQAAAEAERRKEAECSTDLRCWGDKHHLRATVACARYVERLAKYQHEWTDGWFEPKFSRFRWKDKAKGQLTYIGDSIKFQNGFGAWQSYI